MRRAASPMFCALLTGLACLGLTAAAAAGDAPSAARLGKPVTDLVFRDGTAAPLKLADLKGKKAVVVLFFSFDCPVCTSYAQPLADMAKTYGDRGAAFVAVCTGPETGPAELSRKVKEYSVPFPVYHDASLAVADALAAEMTPEAFVLDADFVLRYRGRIDDGYVARLKKSRGVTRHDLKQALDEVLAGKPVSVPATAAVGCPIPRPHAAKVASGSVTYYRDVAPILQNQCQGCHRPGAVGPFSLMTYGQAVNWAKDIKEFTHDRKMPPWKPVEGPAFKDERRLSDREIATLAAWVDAGTPAGDTKDAPPPRDYRDGWHLGKPDLILQVPDDFHLGATGKDLFRCFVLPTDLPEDKYVTAVQVRPGNPRVVHHVLAFVDTAGQGAKMLGQAKDKQDPNGPDRGPGYTSSMGLGFRPAGGLSGWAPGQVPHYLPEGSGYLLPKRADVVIQVHYHRDGRAEKDRTAIGLYFAKKPVQKRFWGITIPGRFLLIPPGNDRYAVKGSVRVEQDCQLHSVMPHMHLLGKEVKVTLTPPDGPAQTLVSIKDWDYNWQETYWFQQPVHVKSGTRLTIEAVYDNSAKNPNNPYSPPRPVLFGEQTTNEMCFGFLGTTSDTPGRIRVRRE